MTVSEKDGRGAWAGGMRAPGVGGMRAPGTRRTFYLRASSIGPRGAIGREEDKTESTLDYATMLRLSRIMENSGREEVVKGAEPTLTQKRSGHYKKCTEEEEEDAAEDRRVRWACVRKVPARKRKVTSTVRYSRVRLERMRVAEELESGQEWTSATLESRRL
jgi:hypothetical protein